MGSKNKLKRFRENEGFVNVTQPLRDDLLNGAMLQMNWTEVFQNENPIVLELGCGKGEYTLALARRYPDKNFIGIDIKGARLWRGAKTAIEEGLKNVHFLKCCFGFRTLWVSSMRYGHPRSFSRDIKTVILTGIRFNR